MASSHQLNVTLLDISISPNVEFLSMNTKETTQGPTQVFAMYAPIPVNCKHEARTGYTSSETDSLCNDGVGQLKLPGTSAGLKGHSYFQAICKSFQL